jgi:hypothetical protein
MKKLFFSKASLLILAVACILPSQGFAGGSSSAMPELPGTSLYMLIGGAGGGLIWIRSFFNRK